MPGLLLQAASLTRVLVFTPEPESTQVLPPSRQVTIVRFPVWRTRTVRGPARSRRAAGSGLGLAIVRQAAEAHGGFAQASNAPGGGAVLRVSFGPTIPLADAEPSAALEV